MEALLNRIADSIAARLSADLSGLGLPVLAVAMVGMTGMPSGLQCFCVRSS